MREFRLDLTECLYRGLRPDARSGRVGLFLSSVENAESTPFGLVSPDSYVNPVLESGGMSKGSLDFPWPQILPGRSQNVLGRKSSLQLLDSDWVPYSVSWVDVNGNPAVLQGNGVWDYVDLGDAWLATNGGSVLMKHGLGRFVNHSNPYLMASGFQINALTYHRGRVLSAGFAASGWNSFWAQILAGFPREVVEEIEVGLRALNEKTVLWSSIGGGDFPFWLFFPQDSAFQFDSEMFLDRVRRNEWGFVEAPWDGTVLKMIPAGDRVIVYGSEGVMELRLANGTYGVQKISSIGIPSRGAAGGVEQIQCFLGTDGALWVWSVEGGIKRLGFEEHLEGLVLEEVLVLFEERLRKFLICSADGTFVLNLEGEPALGWSETVHTSLFFRDGAMLAFSEENEVARFKARTTPFKLPGPGFRRINSVHLQADLGDTLDNHLKVRVYFRYDAGGAWQKGVPVLVNREGNAHVRVQGTEFMVEIEAENPGRVSVERLEVAWHGTDKRFSRGPSAQGSDREV